MLAAQKPEETMPLLSRLHATRRVLLGMPALLAWSASARAQSFPDRPVRWIVPFAAGGGSDTLARLLGAAMQARLGQPIAVENRPGGATAVGAQALAQSPPDGYTMFTADNGTLVNNLALFQRLSYNPDEDFRPVGLTARFSLLLAVPANSPIRDARGFVAAARAEGGNFGFGSPGIGSPHHLAGERLARSANIRLTHVPYRGAAPALNDLIAGVIPAMVIDVASGAEAVRGGRIRALAILSAARFAGLPDVPTAQEALGLAGFEAYAWQSLVVPRRTPDEPVARLAAALAAALAEPSVTQRMREIGLEPTPGDAAAYQRLLASERAVWLPLIRELGITLE
jgi:tripartite-type tricarboxylate transporter receptor subunit TctC